MEGKAGSGLNSTVSMSAWLTAFLFPIFIPAKLRSRITSVHWGKGVEKSDFLRESGKTVIPRLSIIADANLSATQKAAGHPSSDPSAAPEDACASIYAPCQGTGVTVVPTAAFSLSSSPVLHLLFCFFVILTGREYVPQWTCRGQRTTHASQFSPSIGGTWYLNIGG